jgi:DNA polymerase II large subunit
MDEQTRKYHEGLRSEIERIYSLAGKARQKRLDPSLEVEALPAGDLADRVEGLVGPPGIAVKIRQLRKATDNIIPPIIDWVISLKPTGTKTEIEAAAEQALRSALAVWTEGVVAAPIEGIADVKVNQNPDGSQYLSIYFSGPIRSAGGTAQGLAVLAGEYTRQKLGLAEYRPTKDEVERYVEEIKLYDERVSRLQYTPSEEEVRGIVGSLKVCVDGDPTEDMEVAIHRDLARIPSNRIRGGMCLVLAEGMAQKSRKVMKYAEKMSIDWAWLGTLNKGPAKKEDDKPKAKFMDEVVGGRPIFSAPSAKGGFRLRYGHSRSNGIAAKSIHPASMILLDDFIATGTQVKVEKPGKGCVITECDTIEGPIVRLKCGDVLIVDSRKKAYEVKAEVEEVLFLGDLLVTYGDFLQTNTKLVPSGYVEEWWRMENPGANPEPGPQEAVDLALGRGTPLHPRYTYRWADAQPDELKRLVDWLATGASGDGLSVPNDNPAAKRTLEILGIPHRVLDGKVAVVEYRPLLAQLGMVGQDKSRFEAEYARGGHATGLDIVRNISLVKLRNKCGAYIGCRMGRPEKSRERKMQPAVHALYPIGEAGGRERSINAAADTNRVEVDVAQFLCPKCRKRVKSPACPECGTAALGLRTCGSCGYTGNLDNCPRCNIPARKYAKTHVDVKADWDAAVRKVGKSAAVKGVVGMISETKIPEPLEKGLLRALNDVYVFKDGTIRFDATDVPLTHVKPRELGVPVQRLRELGYETDWRGAQLVDDGQVLELKTQDIVVSEYCGDYMVKVAKFVDDLLRKFYGMEPLYGVSSRQELVGHLIVGLAPHTSAGIIGRLIGYTKADVNFAHPFWHAAKRRNADGDEDSIMLLMDMLLNFSRSYLPEKRGGKMDAPLVVTTVMNPKEVDDEAHKLEIVESYGLEFYEKTLQGANPSEVDVKTVSKILDTTPYTGIGFTHDTGDVTGPVTRTRYVTLKSMPEKIEAQLAVAEKIRAIDEREVAEIVINSHFLRDTYGNLRAFSRQRFRCVKCNANYRRVPLAGKCTECGGKLLLTVSQGNIDKYLQMSMDLADKYQLSDYLKSRLQLLERDVKSLTTNDLKKQASLADFM